MNSPQHPICQYAVHHAVGARIGAAYFLYTLPQMALHEDSTRWISRLAENCQLTHQRNVAYALSHWFTYCLHLEIDICRATRDDLVEYKQAMTAHVSKQTGELLSDGTIGQRLSAIINYYEDGVGAGWNRTAIDLRHALHHRASLETHAVPIDKDARDLIPDPKRRSTDIRPLEPKELRGLLDALGPAEGESGRSIRDRLIAEWGAYVGVRIHEVLGNKSRAGLSVHQLNAIVADPDAPLADSVLRIVGKGKVTRSIAVPNWLIIRTQKYIAEERAQLARINGGTSALFLIAPARKKKKPRALSVRRYQAIFQRACIAAGLTRTTSTPSAVLIGARHSFHDLRHTYAVMTYFAEVAIGNREPWKKIQAQLGHASLQTTIDTYLAFVSLLGEWRDLTRASVASLLGLR